MIPTLHRLKLIFVLLALIGIGQVQAQDCEHLGVVSRGFLLGKFSCDILIISSDGLNVFQPTELAEAFTPGSFIRFSYNDLDSTNCSDSVPLIDITCITPFFESADSILNTCNFAIETTPIDTIAQNTFQLEVYNQTDFGSYHPQSVRWYEYETGIELGEESIITYTLGDNSPPVVNICTDIKVELADNSICETTLCSTIVPESIFPSIEDCQALFVYLPEDQMESNGTINFYNLSFGNYEEIVWDFGDGQTSMNDDLSIVHTYAAPGLYEVCLTIKNEAEDCASSFCLPVFTVGGSEICDYNECVFPGDANKDGKVNIFDVLNLGVGFNATGELRPNAVIAPLLQAAFDWDINTFFDLNFKHIDCNGDGVVDAHDFLAIDNNYQPIVADKDFLSDGNLPEISLDFLVDTIFVNSNQEQVTVPAQLKVGKELQQINSFYGLALALDYDNPSVKSVSTGYNEASFAGQASDLFVRDKFIESEQQYAVAITRNNQKSVEGAGEVATVSFILELDIIEGRNQILEIDIKDIITIDSNGVEIPVSVPSDTSKVVIVLEENSIVSTEETLTESQFQIFPNPAKEELFINLERGISLTNSMVQIFNTLGQEVWNQPLTKEQTRLAVNNLESGVYWVKIYTEEGVGVQEIVIK